MLSDLNPARVPLSRANRPTLGTVSSPRMWRADIEVPNSAVDVNSWAELACYPRGSFYPLSYGLSTQRRRITLPDFRLCSTCRSRSQAPLYQCALQVISIHLEGTFGRLRYSLGGDRPSQTAHLAGSPDCDGVRTKITEERYFIDDSTTTGVAVSKSPAYATHLKSRSTAKLQ